MKRLIALSFLSLIFTIAGAQTTIVKDFKPVCDSLNVLMTENTSVDGVLRIKNILKREGRLDFYFDESLGDFPLRRGDVEWFRQTLRNLFPEKYSKYNLGAIYTKSIDIKKLEVASLSFNGSSFKSNHRVSEPSDKERLVTRLSENDYQKGLSGRNIALWQSHGLIYDCGSKMWDWQRPCLFQTVEDMYTQSYVLPFLTPMLENAGAYVMIPRERDIQRHEVIADNDECTGGRGKAEYIEKGAWKDAGSGFGDIREIYTQYEGPFGMGTARKAACTDASDKENTVIWKPEIPERGEYAVYISYISLPESTSAAHYTVNHMGGVSEFVVNQKIGGGTWIYLGTFEFDKGTDGAVTLSSKAPKGWKHKKNNVITADAVKFGGGMGNIARSPKNSEVEPRTSGMPRYVEGAKYWLQYAGADKKIFNASEEENDYKDDYMCRGDWVAWMKESKGIHTDLTLGFHTDAGVTPDDSIVGTLAIYTSESEGKRTLPGGESRMTSREFADIVQSQIVHDIQKQFNQEWSRRQIRDRGYRESRTPSSPSMLLELLSHQNFADMKYGLDPAFRFSVSRAIYKGMLKYLSNRYGIPYVVQPLPVLNIGVSFKDGNKAVISWKATDDDIEPTAVPTGYILYTRIDDGGFDTGRQIKAKSQDGLLTYELDIRPGHIYSFRIQAFNEGGKSFPSETVCIGKPSDTQHHDRKILVVNNFDRVSGPAFFDTDSYAGFDNSLDSGVPYIRDIAYIGEMYQKNRNMEWLTNANPGFGGSYQDYTGKTVAGNTFDIIYSHGKAILKAGYPFYSCSNDAFCESDMSYSQAWCVDLICGKQVTTVIGDSEKTTRYTVFPKGMQEILFDFTAGGGHLIVSGSNIATDIWSGIYQYEKDQDFRKESVSFAENVLGFRWASGYAGRSGEVRVTECERMQTVNGEVMNFHNAINEDHYCVETPDGISPKGKSSTFMRYADTEISAAVCHEGENYKSVSFGFPLETLKEDGHIDTIISLTLDYLAL